LLTQLSIRDIVLIDTLDWHIGEGLSVLTGETGAGKSILLDALGLALGGRGDGGLVRNGSMQGHVSAVFDVALNHPARLAAIEAGLDTGEDLILRRIQMQDGRSRAFLNDQPVSLQVLRRIAGLLVEIHGQHDDRAFADPAAHRSILDCYSGLVQDVEAVADASKTLREAKTALTEQNQRISKARQDGDFLRYSVEELGKLAPLPNEEQILSEQRQEMMQAEKIAQDLNEAQSLFEGRHSLIPALSAVMRKLERRVGQAPNLVAPCVQALEAALTLLNNARDALGHALRETAFEPQDLEKSEERLFALRAAARKYQVQVDDLDALRQTFLDQVASLDAGEDALAALENAVIEAERLYILYAHTLSERRKQAAEILNNAIHQELSPLKLERARLFTHVETDETSRERHGFDRVEFHVQTNPGTKPGPLLKIASGGELSRFLLALKVVLADKGSAPTLIFDEIDTGVGGAVADAIGERLARLGQTVQVLAVTHAPQVAAKAIRHFLIAKTAQNCEDGMEQVITTLRPLEQEERREEIARMLSGASITPEARAAAQCLLDFSIVTPVKI
jgi:DNA repair protein RecN (Recombination protein N)